jgi:hypothetical protein
MSAAHHVDDHMPFWNLHFRASLLSPVTLPQQNAAPQRDQRITGILSVASLDPFTLAEELASGLLQISDRNG